MTKHVKQQKNSPVQVQYFSDSVRYALRGIRLVYQTEKNFRTHVLLAVLAIFLGIALHLSHIKWIILILCIIIMFGTEVFNTAIEYTVDWISNGAEHPKAAQIKDLSAAACLITAFGLLIIGFILFVL